MDDYWDKKATILKYHENIAEKGKKIESNDELYHLAKNKVGKIKFDDEIKKMKIISNFHDLDGNHIRVSIFIGIIGAVTAIFTDYKGKSLEQTFGKNYDKNNPADYWKGSQHRYKFGHDVANPFQKLPNGFVFQGKEVGGKTLYEMICETYCPGKTGVQKLFSSVSHIIVHYLRDFITPDGLPLPGSSFFTKWEENLINFSGFSAKNSLMDILKREYGSLQLSDFASISIIKILTKLYLKNFIAKNSISKEANEILSKQINVITSSSCLILQMYLILINTTHDPKLLKNYSGAKLNLLLLIMFVKNSTQLMLKLDKKHKEIISYYENVINTLDESTK